MGLGLSRRCRPRPLIWSAGALLPLLRSQPRDQTNVSAPPRSSHALAFVGAGLAPPSSVTPAFVAAAFRGGRLSLALDSLASLGPPPPGRPRVPSPALPPHPAHAPSPPSSRHTAIT